MCQMVRCVLFMALLIGSSAALAQYSNESELGIKVEGGNTETESYNAKTLNTYIQSDNTYKLGGHYSYGTSAQVEDTRNWDALLRYERTFNGLGAYAASQIEGDKFKGIEERYNEDIGLLYKFIDTDKETLSAEAGYRYTLQYNTNGTHNKEHKGRVYSAYKRKLNDNVEAGVWVEYLPNFTDGDKWILSFEPHLSVVLSKQLFLKLSYHGDYENQPTAGAKKYDYTYMTALIAKF